MKVAARKEQICSRYLMKIILGCPLWVIMRQTIARRLKSDYRFIAKEKISRPVRAILDAHVYSDSACMGKLPRVLVLCF
ncbi:MAG TPA: hypothetical protein DEP42_01240 [Ruminococcaceae bacterium]|nr:hypothetical protein [Oscillospiraceae bacterium]